MSLLLSVGLSLLGIWLLRPVVFTLINNNAGSLQLNRALLAPDLAAEERLAQAVDAGQSFRNALAWDPLNSQAYYNLGTLYNALGDPMAASCAWSRSAALNTNDASSRFALGQALAAQGFERRALAEWRAADAARFFLNSGLELVRAGERGAAVEQYQRAIAIAPDLGDGYYYLARALNALGRREEALSVLESAAALEPPSSPRRYLLQAEVHVAREEWTAALAALRWAADAEPSDPVPHYRIGWVLERHLGAGERAAAHYQQALDIDPLYVAPRQALGNYYANRGRCDEAARWLFPLLAQQASTKTGANSGTQLHRHLANCLLEDGREAEALAHLRQALEMNPESISKLLTLAQAYTQTGRYSEAIDVYLQVLDIQPNNPQAPQALEELHWSVPADDGP